MCIEEERYGLNVVCFPKVLGGKREKGFQCVVLGVGKLKKQNVGHRGTTVINGLMPT